MTWKSKSKLVVVLGIRALRFRVQEFRALNPKPYNPIP